MGGEGGGFGRQGQVGGERVGGGRAKWGGEEIECLGWRCEMRG